MFLRTTRIDLQNAASVVFSGGRNMTVRGSRRPFLVRILCVPLTERVLLTIGTPLVVTITEHKAKIGMVRVGRQVNSLAVVALYHTPVTSQPSFSGIAYGTTLYTTCAYDPSLVTTITDPPTKQFLTVQIDRCCLYKVSATVLHVATVILVDIGNITMVGWTVISVTLVAVSRRS